MVKMANRKGNFIKLDRKILDWGWYKDANTMKVFIHCLLKANWKDGDFQGITIRRGQFATSISELSQQTGLTPQNVRTAINHLISTNEITNQSTKKYRIITVNNYDLYQDDNKQTNRQLTNSQQTANKVANNNRRIYKEGNNERREDIRDILYYCDEPNKSESTQPVISLPSVSGNEVPVSQVEVDELSKLYPAVDVMQQLRNMRGWLLANPERRKTERGMKRFVNSWLAKTQNRNTGNNTPRRDWNETTGGDQSTDWKKPERDLPGITVLE